MGNVIRVALPTYNALTDTNPDHFALYSDQDWVLIKEFTRINIEARQLNTEELIKLLYEEYNPDANLPNNANVNIKDYTAPMVEVLQ